MLFEVEDVVLARPVRSVPTVVVSASEDDLTGVAGVALWGRLLDRLNVVAEADRRGLRPIGPTGYCGGECYRALTEILLAGGDFLSDRSLLADEATRTLRGTNALPSVPTLWRFLAGADLGRVAKAAAVNRVMLRRAWAAGAAPEGEVLTIDPDATRVPVYGPGKEGSAFSRTGQTALSPLVGVLGETGDVLALRARRGSANDGRAMGSFIDECVTAIPAGVRGRYRLWIRVDSAGYQDQVIAAAERHDADYTVTTKDYPNVPAAVHTLATGPDTAWVAAEGNETGKGLPDRRDHHRPARPAGAADRAPPAPKGRGTVRDRRPGRLAAARDHHQHRCGADDRCRGRGPPPAAGRDPRGHHPGVEERLRHDPRPGRPVLRQLAVLAGVRPGPQRVPVAAHPHSHDGVTLSA
ncbi:MAG TPA: transposase [Kineosporiaceae bacterium]